MRYLIKLYKSQDPAKIYIMYIIWMRNEKRVLSKKIFFVTTLKVLKMKVKKDWNFLLSNEGLYIQMEDQFREDLYSNSFKMNDYY